VLSRSYAGRLHVDVDQNWELAVLGVANVAAGCAGVPHLLEQLADRGRRGRRREEPVRGARGGGRPALLLIFGTGLLHDLPTATLAAIACRRPGFIDIRARRLLWWRRSEFILAMVAFAGVAYSACCGASIAIALSLLNPRAGVAPPRRRARRVDNLKGYHDTERHPEARLIPGLVLYRFDAPIFANAELFREHVAALARPRTSAGSSWPPSR
jgi:MFS superfamily sulfate permease-like transporter